MEERAALEMKYSDLCKPIYKERRNVVAGRLDDEIQRIHKQVGGQKEEDGSQGYVSDKDGREGKEMEGTPSLEDAPNNNKIYGDIFS